MARRDPDRLSWREPLLWLVIGPPLAAVLGGLATVWIAITYRDPLVDEHVRKHGMTWQRVERRAPEPSEERATPAPTSPSAAARPDADGPDG